MGRFRTFGLFPKMPDVASLQAQAEEKFEELLTELVAIRGAVENLNGTVEDVLAELTKDTGGTQD